MEYETVLLGEEELFCAAQWISKGEIVAFPTETVYGLGGNALSREAVEKIFAVKGRPSDNPLILHIAKMEMLEPLVEGVSKEAALLMELFWPGPLTLVLPKTKRVPGIVTGGLNTVGVRIPAHELARQLIHLSGNPVAAPSANLSGRPSPTLASHVYADLYGRIPAILDGGPAGFGLESTVVDCTTRPLQLLRPGGITLEALQAVVDIQGDRGIKEGDVPRAPGMKYRHYSPDAQVIVVVGGEIPRTIREVVRQYQKEKKTVGIMACTENLGEYPEGVLLDLGSKEHLETMASRLYGLLRKGDALGLQVILVEGLEERQLGHTIMNRVKKAAGYHIIHS